MGDRPGPLTLGAFALVALFGGSNIVAVRLSNRELDPFWGAGSRFAVAAVLLFAIVLIGRVEFPRGRALTGAVVFGLLNFFAFFAFAYFALQPGGVPSALGGVIFGLIPLLTLLFAVAQRTEHFRVRALVGAVIAGGGVAAMIRAPANADVPIVYVGSMLAAAACAAEASIIVKRFPPSHAIAMNAVGMAVGAPLLLVISALTGEAWILPERTTTWLTLAYVIPVGSIALFILYLYVLHHWTASAASYEFVFFPVVAALVAALVADEPLTVSIAISAGLVIAGVYIGVLSGRRDDAVAAPSGT
jgi:drug/metabolite transporter (DMT)-like permease